MVSGPAVAAGAVSPPHEYSSCEVPPPPGKRGPGQPGGLALRNCYVQQRNQVAPGLAGARYYLGLKCPFSQLPGVLVADSSLS